MSDLHQVKEVDNEKKLRILAWVLEADTGQFSLILAHCNLTNLQEQLVEHLQELCAVKPRVILLRESIQTLYTTIQDELRDEQPTAVIVLGLESVRELERVLISTNQVRDEFCKNFHFPLVLWVNDQVLIKMKCLAPDFENKSRFTLL